jgi:hypothetical protein
LGLVFLIELGFDGCHLASLEVGDFDGTPELSGTGHAGKHQLEHGLLAEGIYQRS